MFPVNMDVTQLGISTAGEIERNSDNSMGQGQGLTAEWVGHRFWRSVGIGL